MQVYSTVALLMFAVDVAVSVDPWLSQLRPIAPVSCGLQGISPPDLLLLAACRGITIEHQRVGKSVG
jgi:hypothetical protein